MQRRRLLRKLQLFGMETQKASGLASPPLQQRQSDAGLYRGMGVDEVGADAAGGSDGTSSKHVPGLPPIEYAGPPGARGHM